MATQVAGGVVINGKWGFSTGALHAAWQQIIAIQQTPDNQPLPVVALIPLSDLQVLDDWYTFGLKGTGSVSTVTQDVFVP